jgi:hypothetical protein
MILLPTPVGKRHTKWDSGEGYLSIRLAKNGLEVTGSDVDPKIVEEAIENARTAKVDVRFTVLSLYDLDARLVESRDLFVCCEVLEHTADPQKALGTIVNLNPRHLLVSVPREPIWRILNEARARYLRDLGNTPGHVQHWSTRQFLEFLQRKVDVISVRTPLPWTLALCKPRKAIAW